MKKGTSNFFKDKNCCFKLFDFAFATTVWNAFNKFYEIVKLNFLKDENKFLLGLFGLTVSLKSETRKATRYVDIGTDFSKTVVLYPSPSSTEAVSFMLDKAVISVKMSSSIYTKFIIIVVIMSLV